MKILKKIIDFIKNVFSNQKKLTKGKTENNENINKKNDFIELLQKDQKEYTDKNKILEEINKNPEIINKLSYTRLVQLNSIYEEKIKELNIKLTEKPNNDIIV